MSTWNYTCLYSFVKGKINITHIVVFIFLNNYLKYGLIFFDFRLEYVGFWIGKKLSGSGRI